MAHPITEHVAKTDRHASFYLACGPEDGPLIIFCHGWPELSLSWRGQLPVMAGLGFRAIAPDMRGYGRSTLHPNRGDYRVEEIERDMVELLDALGADQAIWVGHDWGAPVVWSLAQHHPQRCRGVAGLCVPYLPGGFVEAVLLPLADRTLYPADEFPLAQWDYWAFYRDNFDDAVAAFEADPLRAVTILFRAGDPARAGERPITATVRARGGWFGPDRAAAPDLPLDTRLLSKADAFAYSAALTRSGFAGPASWYVNDAANAAHAERARAAWRLAMPTLFLHGAYDAVCETMTSRLAEPMRAHCEQLTEAVIPSGHWMAQEQPEKVNAALAKWLATAFPDLWP